MTADETNLIIDVLNTNDGVVLLDPLDRANEDFDALVSAARSLEKRGWATVSEATGPGNAPGTFGRD